MTHVAPQVVDYWRRAFAGDVVAHDDHRCLVISAILGADRPAMILERADGSLQVALHTDFKDRIGPVEPADIALEPMRARLAQLGISLHDPDHVFYPRADDAVAPPRHDASAPRRLTDADRAAFEIFHSAASELDREDAWVELDHWAVFGQFEGDRLISAASLYPWKDSVIVDLGVLTLPEARGKGYGRAVVQAINLYARQQGREPQYRCQRDNHASVALAQSCGLRLFGTWVVAADGEG